MTIPESSGTADILLKSRTEKLINQLRELEGTLMQQRNISLQGVEKADKMLELAFHRMKLAQTDREKNAWLFILSVATYAFEATLSFHGATLGSTEFGRSIGLKNAVHKIYEFDAMFSGTYIRNVKKIADDFNVSVDVGEIRSIRKNFGEALATVRTYQNVRNVAGGHFDEDMLKYVEAVQSLDFSRVNMVHMALMNFSAKIAELVFGILRDAKKNDAPEFRAI